MPRSDQSWQSLLLAKVDGLCALMEETNAKVDRLADAIERVSSAVDDLGDGSGEMEDLISQFSALSAPETSKSTCEEVRAKADKTKTAPPVDETDDDDESPPEVADQAFILPTSLAGLEGLLQQEDFAEAERVSGTILEERPSCVRALRVRGTARLALGMHEGARTDLREAQSLDYDPNYDTPLAEACAGVMASAGSPLKHRRGKSTSAPPPKFDTPGQMPDVAAMMKDPSVMSSMQSLLQNPEALAAIQNSDLFRQMMG